MSVESLLYALAQRVGMSLLENNRTLAAAESCTGGWICQSLTDVAGSSAWFDRGFVTYSNEAKQELLGVPESVLAEHGAVSEETVRAMAAGALRNSRADCALAVSGIAGPSGGTPSKPVGTVWFSWQRRGGPCVARRVIFAGNRRSVRQQAVAEALNGTLELFGLPRVELPFPGKRPGLGWQTMGSMAAMDKKPRHRLFFALWPQESVCEEMQPTLRRLQTSLTARWVPPQNLHMTLAFLGDIETGRLPGVKAAASFVRAQAFEMLLDRIEHWRRPQVICLSPSKLTTPLERLAAELAANLRAEGFELDDRPFRAHMTLARKAPFPPQNNRLDPPIRWPCDSFALVESRHDSGGSHYVILDRFDLANP